MVCFSPIEARQLDRGLSPWKGLFQPQP